jgi:hypothetical protein
MKINITKKEYRVLVEMLYLADWMMHSHAIGETQHHHEHEALRKKILSHYKEMQAEDIIEFSEELDNFYENSDYDEHIHEKFIEPYDDQTFWDELIDGLAERDLVNDIGIEQFRSMEGIERVMKVEEVKERYANEFEQHGLKHVIVKYEDVVKN